MKQHDPVDEATMITQNVNTYLPVNTTQHNTNTPEHLNLHTVLIQAWMFIRKSRFIEIFSVTTGKYWDSNFKFPVYLFNQYPWSSSHLI